MITAEERRYLHWLGREFWTARGEVVEIGPWLGGSTYSLAAGMAAHGAKAHGRLHVFDSFRWRPFMSQRAPLPLNAGDDFQAYFEKNLEPYRDLLVVERQSIPDDRVTSEGLTAIAERRDVAEHERLRWSGGNIEILFIDGAKSWDGLLYLLKEVAPSIVPGLTVLVCQDYKHWGSYWVPAILELFADHLRLLHLLDRNTVSFQCIKPITEEQLLRLAAYDSISATRGAELLESAALRLQALGDAAGAVMLRLTKARYLAQRGASDWAIDEFRRTERASSPRHHSRAVEDTRRWLETLLNVRLVPTPWFRARSESYRLLNQGHQLYARARRLMRLPSVVPPAP